MTDQTPDREPLTITYEGFSPEAIRKAFAPLAEQFARMRFRNAARLALTACLDGDDQQAARLLTGLDSAQLYAIEGAGSGLAIHASRHRKRLAQADETEDVERCPAQTGPVWKAGGEPCGCTLARGHDGDHQCECGAWFVDSVRRDGDAEQPEPTRPDADQHAGPALYKRIRTVLDPFTAGDPDRLADPVWEEIAPVLVEYRDEAREQRHRAETAERERGTAREALAAAGVVIASLRDQRDEQRQRAARANVQATALLRRAETAERQATEHKARAQRAEADAADWRTTAHGYEQALRAEQDKARLLAGDLAQERRAAGTYRQQRDAAREDAETAVRRLNQIEPAVARAREMLAHEIRTGNGASAYTLRRIFTTLDGPEPARDGTSDPGAWRP